MSKFNGNRNNKDHANAESSQHDGGQETMFSLEMLVAALNLMAEQRAAERNVRQQHDLGDIGSDAASSMPHNQSASISEVSSATLTSNTHSTPVSVQTESSSSSANARNAEHSGLQYVSAEEGSECNHDDGEPVPVPAGQPPSTRWYCVIRGHAVGVFVGWPNTSPLIINVPGSLFQRYPTFNAALNAFVEASTNGSISIILT